MANNRLRVNISTSAINKALAKYKLAVGKQLLEDLKEAAEYGAEVAEMGYRNALYDGEVDAVVSVVKSGKYGYSIVAKGECVKFIEYGTGVGRDPGYKNPRTDRPYWWFSGKGKNIRLTAGGTLAKNTYWRTTEDSMDEDEAYVFVHKAIGNAKGFETDLSDPGLEADAEGVYEYYDEETDEYYPVTIKSGKKRKKVKPYRVDKGFKTDSYVTSGNPANFVMLKAKQAMLREFYGKVAERKP